MDKKAQSSSRAPRKKTYERHWPEGRKSFWEESQDYPLEKSIPRKSGKLGSNRAVTFSTGTWHLAKNDYKRKARDKAHVLLPYRSMGNAGTLSKKPQEREFVTDSGASLHILGKKDLSSGELETLRKSRNPTTVSTANGHACRQALRRARMY